MGSARAFGEPSEHGHQCRTCFDSVGTTDIGLVQRTSPLIKLKKGRIGPQALRPRLRKAVERFASSSGIAEQPAYANLAKPVQQDVSERRAGLTFPRRQHGQTVREMEWQTRIWREH